MDLPGWGPNHIYPNTINPNPNPNPHPVVPGLRPAIPNLPQAAKVVRADHRKKAHQAALLVKAPRIIDPVPRPVEKAAQAVLPAVTESEGGPREDNIQFS